MDQVHSPLLYSLGTKSKILDLYYNIVVNKDIENEIKKRKEKKKGIYDKDMNHTYLKKGKCMTLSYLQLLYAVVGNCMNFSCNTKIVPRLHTKIITLLNSLLGYLIEILVHALGGEGSTPPYIFFVFLIIIIKKKRGNDQNVWSSRGDCKVHEQEIHNTKRRLRRSYSIPSLHMSMSYYSFINLI